MAVLLTFLKVMYNIDSSQKEPIIMFGTDNLQKKFIVINIYVHNIQLTNNE